MSDFEIFRHSTHATVYCFVFGVVVVHGSISIDSRLKFRISERNFFVCKMIWFVNCCRIFDRSIHEISSLSLEIQPKRSTRSNGQRSFEFLSVDSLFHPKKIVILY